MGRWRLRTRVHATLETTVSERERVALARHDTRAFHDLFSEHRDAVYRFAVHQCHDRDAAEDVAQETLIRAFAGFDAFVDRGEGSIRAWLITIARNVMIDLRRKRTVTTEPLAEHPYIDPALSPDEALMRSDDRKTYRALIATLPEDQRQVMALLAADLNATQIGALLDKQPAHVRKLHQRALKTLVARVQTRDGGDHA